MKNAPQTTSVTHKVTKRKKAVNTIKKDNGQRKVKKIAKAFPHKKQKQPKEKKCYENHHWISA